MDDNHGGSYTSSYARSSISSTINPSAPVPLVVLIKHPEENASTINEEAIQSSDIDETTVKSMKWILILVLPISILVMPGPPVPSGYTRYFVLFNVHKESKEAVTVLETLKELGGKLVTILSDADGAVIDLPPGVLSRAKVTQHVDEIIPVE
ncbi:hypothetical protein BDF22DRAFT_744813 [Syncephalis plumigaleata]|nr:hypothetical protein BDF22DRAFT_744813 [Syncephalis plumigaleata]